MRIFMAASAVGALLVSSGAVAASTDASPPWSVGQPQLRPIRSHVNVATREQAGYAAIRETAALNNLEAAGYTAMRNVEPVDTNVMVDAKKLDGDFQPLVVLPDGAIRSRTTADAF